MNEILAKSITGACDDTVGAVVYDDITAMVIADISEHNSSLDAHKQIIDNIKKILDNQSGTNTGDQDLSGLVSKTTTINGHALNSNVTVSATDVGAPKISNGSGVPSTTPAKIGDIYIDTTNCKTYISKGASSSSDWIKQNGSYTLTAHNFATGNFAPNNATTYYLGTSGVYSTNTGQSVMIPRSGTIVRVDDFILVNGILGSNETSSLYLRVNNTTDYLVSNNVVNSSSTRYTNSLLNISVNAGDTVALKWVTPTWSTKPTSVIHSGIITIDL